VSTLDCACKNGSQEACAQLAATAKASKIRKPKEPSTPKPPVDPVLPPVTSEDSEEPDDTKKRCADYYARCVDAGGERKPGRHKGIGLCGSCLEYCTTNGFWPAAIYTWNGERKPCPGG
jgi:hypothetical protein